MWKRKNLKRNAKHDLKQNYWGIVITCVLFAILLGFFSNPVSNAEKTANVFTQKYDHQAGENTKIAATGRTEEVSNSEIVDEFLGGAGMDNDGAKKWTSGVLSVFARNTMGSGNLIYGIMNSINQMAFHDRVSPGIIIAIGTLLGLFLMIFVQNVLQAGFCRYMLEIRTYSHTRINRLLFPWSVRRGGKIARILLLKDIYQFLWSLTFIGGVIKRYSYRMVPYIAAENPDISARDAITLSRSMMQGNKWQAFMLDLSFIPWKLLNLVTFNILGILFLTPYTYFTDTELYMFLRASAKERNLRHSELLCDQLLISEITAKEYPVDQYMIPPAPARQWAHADYDRNYSITSLILIFFSFSLVGWLWEVSLHLFTNGVFVNRGVSYGPWLPIYGTGGTLVLILLKKIRKKPALTFLTTMVVCGIVEYATSWFLEFSKGMRWWDYSGYFLNLNGRVCLEGLIVFAFGGCAAIYLIAPALDDLFMKIPKKVRITICSILVTVFLCDQVYSHFIPNSGDGITDY